MLEGDSEILHPHLQAQWRIELYSAEKQSLSDNCKPLSAQLSQMFKAILDRGAFSLNIFFLYFCGQHVHDQSVLRKCRHRTVVSSRMTVHVYANLTMEGAPVSDSMLLKPSAYSVYTSVAYREVEGETSQLRQTMAPSTCWRAFAKFLIHCA